MHDHFPKVRIEQIDVARGAVVVYHNRGLVEVNTGEPNTSDAGSVVQIPALDRLYPRPNLVVDRLGGYDEVG